MNSKRIIVLVGPSGSGKTTIGEKLSDKGMHKLVTTTTRAPRVGETDGVDYYFRSVDELDPEDFVEQTIYNHRLYGLTKSEVSQALKNHPLVHVSLDKNGARAMKKAFPEETLIIFLTVSAEDMKERMECRGDAPQKISERLTFCEQTDELEPLDEADVILENRTVDDTVARIFKVISSGHQADISANGA